MSDDQHSNGEDRNTWRCPCGARSERPFATSEEAEADYREHVTSTWLVLE